MNWARFSTHVSGKWVLSGEHSVLRGVTAIALPLKEMGLTLSFLPDERDEGIQVNPKDAASVLKDLIDSIAEAWESEGKSFPRPQGKLTIDSTIPIGAGLGSSAALCVALTHWMMEPLGISPSEVSEFATRLEHRFHGRSSGMDVAVIATREPVAFMMEGGVKLIGVRKLPRFTFHDTGLRTRTSDCVLSVEKFCQENPITAMGVDEMMAAASRLAVEGLVQYDAGNKTQGLALIQKSMHQSRDCFYSWGLVPQAVRAMEEDLLSQGALAVKLTGAGGGGMIVALWPDANGAASF